MPPTLQRIRVQMVAPETQAVDSMLSNDKCHTGKSVGPSCGKDTTYRISVSNGSVYQPEDSAHDSSLYDITQPDNYSSSIKPGEKPTPYQEQVGGGGTIAGAAQSHNQQQQKCIASGTVAKKRVFNFHHISSDTVGVNARNDNNKAINADNDDSTNKINVDATCINTCDFQVGDRTVAMEISNDFERRMPRCRTVHDSSCAPSTSTYRSKVSLHPALFEGGNKMGSTSRSKSTKQGDRTLETYNYYFKS